MDSLFVLVFAFVLLPAFIFSVTKTLKKDSLHHLSLAAIPRDNATGAGAYGSAVGMEKFLLMEALRGGSVQHGYHSGPASKKMKWAARVLSEHSRLRRGQLNTTSIYLIGSHASVKDSWARWMPDRRVSGVSDPTLGRRHEDLM